MAQEPKVIEKNHKRNPLVVIGVLLISVIALFFAARSLIPQVIVYLTQAARPTNYSLSNSYVFGAPLSAEADGQTKVRVSAFLLNDEGKGVADKQINLQVAPKDNATGTPQIGQVQPMTDKFGKAVFEVVSSTAGQYVATAVVDSMEIPQTVTLTFR
jgi:hypothetical protein